MARYEIRSNGEVIATANHEITAVKRLLKIRREGNKSAVLFDVELNQSYDDADLSDVVHEMRDRNNIWR